MSCETNTALSPCISGTTSNPCKPFICSENGAVMRIKKELSPPIRKSSPATYCMSSCCLQQPSTPMIHPKRMMETAIPMKPAVILRRSEGMVVQRGKKVDMGVGGEREGERPCRGNQRQNLTFAQAISQLECPQLVRSYTTLKKESSSTS